MKLKSNKGIGLTDTIIAIVIFIVFSTIIISISYNIYLQSNFIKRNDTATNFIIEAFEQAKSLNFNSFNDNNNERGIDDEIETNISNIFVDRNEITTFGLLTDEELNTNLNQYKGYIMQIVVNDIHNEKPTQYDENIVKQISITVYYRLAGKIKSVSMSTLINI